MRAALGITAALLSACDYRDSLGHTADAGAADATDAAMDAAVDASAGPVSPAYIKASNTGANDRFGWSVALSADGSTLAVGAFGESSGASGVGGNQADNSLPATGAVYVFTCSGGTWSQQAYLKPTYPMMLSQFGYRVALSADGSTLAVSAESEGSGAAYSGAVYVFTRSGTIWSPQEYLKPPVLRSNTHFGFGLALSADGSTLAVGARGDRSGATGINGDQADTSAPSSGAVYVFVRSGVTWTAQAYVKASNTTMGQFFGTSVALSGDGSTLVVGAMHEDSAASGVDGDQADTSAPGAGAAYVFTRSGTTWSQQAYLKASNPGQRDSFGFSIALSNDGSTLAVGAYLEDSSATGIDDAQADDSALDAGAVYVFTRSGATWSQQAYVKASNTDADDQFGIAVALSADGSTLAVSAVREDSAAVGINGAQADNSVSNAGAIYMFTRSGTAWSQQAYVKASNPDVTDQFGDGVALTADGSIMAVGASRESSSATGIDGDQTSNLVSHAGAVYLLSW